MKHSNHRQIPDNYYTFSPLFVHTHSLTTCIKNVNTLYCQLISWNLSKLQQTTQCLITQNIISHLTTQATCQLWTHLQSEIRWNGKASMEV